MGARAALARLEKAVAEGPMDRHSHPMTAKAPNVLIVMADQMAPAFLPIYGHPLTRAPNMQALAQQGVVFDSAYCNSPLCSPVARLVHVGPAALAHPRL